MEGYGEYYDSSTGSKYKGILFNFITKRIMD